MGTPVLFLAAQEMREDALHDVHDDASHKDD